MLKQTKDVADVLALLPPICAIRLLSDGSPILIRRGVIGYYPANPKLDVDRYNERHCITPAQKEAMEIGSMCGFDVPGANPENYISDFA